MIIEGRVFTRSGIQHLCIKVSEDGLIEKLSKVDCRGDVKYSFMDKGLVILPAMIDIHVHMRDFKLSYKEDFYTGSAAAAAGGVGVIADMPNTVPRVNSIKILRMRDETASNKSLVDYGLYYGVPDNEGDINGYEEYAIGLKIYPEDLHRRGILDKILQYNNLRGILTVYHPEDPDLIGDSHPLKAELKAAYDIAGGSSENLKTHLTHISSGSTYRIVSRYGRGYTVDTCPHYLFLYRDYYSSRYYNVAPPLRSRWVMLDLFKTFLNGYIKIISTDHAPHTYDEKIDGINGFPGLETALPLLLTLFNKGLIRLSDVISLYSRNPARLLGIDHLYGSIDEGMYASLTIVDLYSEYKIDSSKFYSKAKHSPFDGWRVSGRVIATFIRGKPVYMDNEILIKKGIGLNIRKIIREFPYIQDK